MSVANKTIFESVDAVELLRADHERIRMLLSEFEHLHAIGAQAEARSAAQSLCRELTIHSALEAEIFYPEMRAMLANPELVKSARAEHAVIARLCSQIAAGSVHGPRLAARMAALSRCVESHMREEEEEIFSRARAAEFDMYEIGARIEARRFDLQNEAADGVDAGPVARRLPRGLKCAELFDKPRAA